MAVCRGRLLIRPTRVRRGLYDGTACHVLVYGKTCARACAAIAMCSTSEGDSLRFWHSYREKSPGARFKPVIAPLSDLRRRHQSLGMGLL